MTNTFIDVHAHYNHPDYFKALDATGCWDEVGIMKILGHLWRPKPDGEGPKARAVMADSDEALRIRLQAMDAAGVDKQVLSLGAAHPYISDRAAGADVVSLVNDRFAEAVARAPDRLLSYACLPLPHIDESIAEIRRVMANPAFIGVGLGCSALGIPLDDDRFEPVWAELNKHHAAVYLHPGVGIDKIVGCLDYHLAPDFVSPAEMAVAICRLIVRGVVGRYANITFVAATLGGLIPFLANRFDRGLLQDNPDDHAHIGGAMRHFRKLYYDTSVTEEPLALLAMKEIGLADRLILGSDFSRPDADLPSAVAYVANSKHLSDAEKHATLVTNGNALVNVRAAAQAA